MSSRQTVERDIRQGEDESIAYTITTTPWGTSPSSVVVKIYDESDGSPDVTTSVATGSASVLANVITLPAIAHLTAGHVYRVEVQFTCSGNTFEAYFLITAER